MGAAGVVLDPDAGELGLEQNWVVDVFEVGPLALDVTDEASTDTSVSLHLRDTMSIFLFFDSKQDPGAETMTRRGVELLDAVR